MAEPKVVATVVRVDGQVLARNADGEVRLLKAGDILREGEVVVTASGARVELAYADGGATSIPEDSSVLISEEMTEAARPDARAASVEDATIAQVIQAIETGQDLDQVLEDPAAGLAGGGAGEGSSFVRLLRISEEIGQTTFDFAEAQGGVIGEFDGALKYDGGLGRPEDVIMAEKRREQAFRDEGWWLVRWGWSELLRPAELAERVRRALDHGRRQTS